MPSTYFQRLKDRYGTENIKNKKYQSLVSEIIERNNTKIGRGVARLSNQHYKDRVKQLGEKAKTVKLPTDIDVLPKRAVLARKSAERGKLITETLHKRLMRDLRETLLGHEAEGKPKMEIQRGRTTGKINNELVKKFQAKIVKTFESSTMRDRKTGVPPNVRNIAVTEVRSTINSIKENYNRELMKRNPGAMMEKIWRHNRRLSKEPRLGHMELDNKAIMVDEKFKVNRYKKIKGKNVLVGIDMMSRPHDDTAPPDQVIGCSCDIVYKTIVLKEI